MKTIFRFAVAVTLLSSTALAQEPQPPELTKQHKAMAKEAGVWDGEMKMWMAPGADPMTMPIVETNTLLDGGLWLHSKFDGGPFQGRGHFGYDANKNEHVGTWIDNMSTHLSIMKGNLNDEGELVMYSTGFDPATNKEVNMKSVSSTKGEDEKQFMMYRQGANEGEWVKAFEISYKRRKS